MTPEASQEEENKELIRLFNDWVWGRGRTELIDEHIADKYVEHHNMFQEPVKGPEGYKKNLWSFLRAFPDLSVTNEDIIAEDNKVAVRTTITGTHRGPFKGVEPTNKKIKVSGIFIGRVKNGRFVEAWSNIDALGLMKQLGAFS